MARFPEAEARLLHRKICMKCNARNAMRAARCRKCSYKGLRLKNVERKGI
ncbi:MAG: 50S ribosomal protein L40e [Euryarchaeota archaeon]|nr:50S ribosomal protein L40e [Euryarchaeota archaeon]MBT5255267.1 50S ribosomal protein L40e [Euryarchaeota archaeon]